MSISTVSSEQENIESDVRVSNHVGRAIWEMSRNYVAWKSGTRRQRVPRGIVYHLTDHQYLKMDDLYLKVKWLFWV